MYSRSSSLAGSLPPSARAPPTPTFGGVRLPGYECSEDQLADARQACSAAVLGLSRSLVQSFKLELTDAPDDATGAIDTRKLAELSGAVCAAAPAEAYVLAASVKAGGRTCAGAIAAILSWHSTGQEALNLALGPAAASASCSEISAYDLFCLEVPWQATTAGGVVGVALAADVAVSAILAYVFAAVRNLDLDEPTAGALCVVGFGAAKRGFGADRWGRPLAALAPQYTPMLLRESAKVIAGEYDSALVAALVTSSSFTIDSEVPGTVTAFDLMSAQCEGHNHLRDLPGHGGTFFKLLRDLHEAIVERPRDPEMFPADAELFGITARAQTIVAEAILGKAAPDDAWGAAAALAVRCAPDVARVRSVGVAAAAAAALHTNKRALATEALLIVLRGLPREDANLVEGILPKAFDPKRVGLHLKERKDAALVAASLVGLADIAVAATKAAGTGDPVYRLLGASDEMGNASKRLVDKSALLFAACGLRAARTVILDAKSHSQDFVAALRARMADAVEKLLPTADLLASSVRALDALPASEHGDALTEAAAIATLCEQIFASTAAASKKSGPRKTQLFGTVSSGAPSKSRELGGALVLYECCKCLQLLPYMPSGSFSVAANLLTHTLLPVSAAAQRAVVEAIAAAGSAAGEDAIAAQVGHAVARLPLGSSERLTGAVFAKTIIAGSASLAAAEAVALPMLVCADRRHRLAAVLLMEAIASKTPPRTSNVSSAVFAQEVLIGQKAVSCMAAGTGAVRAPRLGVMCNIDEVWAHCVCSIAEIAGNPAYRDVTELVWAQLRSDTGVWTAAGGIANTLALAFAIASPPEASFPSLNDKIAEPLEQLLQKGGSGAELLEAFCTGCAHASEYGTKAILEACLGRLRAPEKRRADRDAVAGKIYKLVSCVSSSDAFGAVLESDPDLACECAAVALADLPGQRDDPDKIVSRCVLLAQVAKTQLACSRNVVRSSTTHLEVGWSLSHRRAAFMWLRLVGDEGRVDAETLLGGALGVDLRPPSPRASRVRPAVAAAVAPLLSLGCLFTADELDCVMDGALDGGSILDWFLRCEALDERVLTPFFVHNPAVLGPAVQSWVHRWPRAAATCMLNALTDLLAPSLAVPTLELSCVVADTSKFYEAVFDCPQLIVADDTPSAAADGIGCNSEAAYREAMAHLADEYEGLLVVALRAILDPLPATRARALQLCRKVVGKLSRKTDTADFAYLVSGLSVAFTNRSHINSTHSDWRAIVDAAMATLKGQDSVARVTEALLLAPNAPALLGGAVTDAYILGALCSQIDLAQHVKLPQFGRIDSSLDWEECDDMLLTNILEYSVELAERDSVASPGAVVWRRLVAREANFMWRTNNRIVLKFTAQAASLAEEGADASVRRMTEQIIDACFEALPEESAELLTRPFTSRWWDAAAENTDGKETVLVDYAIVALATLSPTNPAALFQHLGRIFTFSLLFLESAGNGGAGFRDPASAITRSDRIGGMLRNMLLLLDDDASYASSTADARLLRGISSLLRCADTGHLSLEWTSVMGNLGVGLDGVPVHDADVTKALLTAASPGSVCPKALILALLAASEGVGCYAIRDETASEAARWLASASRRGLPMLVQKSAVVLTAIDRPTLSTADLGGILAELPAKATWDSDRIKSLKSFKDDKSMHALLSAVLASSEADSRALAVRDGDQGYVHVASSFAMSSGADAKDSRAVESIDALQRLAEIEVRSKMRLEAVMNVVGSLRLPASAPVVLSILKGSAHVLPEVSYPSSWQLFGLIAGGMAPVAIELGALALDRSTLAEYSSASAAWVLSASGGLLPAGPMRLAASAAAEGIESFGEVGAAMARVLRQAAQGLPVDASAVLDAASTLAVSLPLGLESAVASLAAVVESSAGTATGTAAAALRVGAAIISAAADLSREVEDSRLSQEALTAVRAIESAAARNLHIAPAAAALLAATGTPVAAVLDLSRTLPVDAGRGAPRKLTPPMPPPPLASASVQQKVPARPRRSSSVGDTVAYLDGDATLTSGVVVAVGGELGDDVTVSNREGRTKTVDSEWTVPIAMTTAPPTVDSPLREQQVQDSAETFETRLPSKSSEDATLVGSADEPGPLAAAAAAVVPAVVPAVAEVETEPVGEKKPRKKKARKPKSAPPAGVPPIGKPAPPAGVPPIGKSKKPPAPPARVPSVGKSRKPPPPPTSPMDQLKDHPLLLGLAKEQALPLAQSGMVAASEHPEYQAIFKLQAVRVPRGALLNRMLSQGLEAAALDDHGLMVAEAEAEDDGVWE